jgi:hypothetical protein
MAKHRDTAGAGGAKRGAKRRVRRAGRRTRDSDKDVIVSFISRQISESQSGDVLNPRVRACIDDAERGSGRCASTVGCGDIVTIVPGVVPNLVTAANLRDGRHDVTIDSVHDVGIAAGGYQHLLKRSEGKPIDTRAASRLASGYIEFLGNPLAPGIDHRFIRQGSGNVNNEPVELSVPDRLLHPVGVGKVDLSNNLIRICLNEHDSRRRGCVKPEQDEALNRIVCEFIGTAFSWTTNGDRLNDSWWAQVQVNNLHCGVAISRPQDIVRGHEHTIGPRVSDGRGHSDKTSDLTHENTINGIEDVYGLVCPVGEIHSPPGLIDPHDVNTADKSAAR